MLWTKSKISYKSGSRRMIWHETLHFITWSMTWWKIWITFRKTWLRMFKETLSRKRRLNRTNHLKKWAKTIVCRRNIVRKMQKMKRFWKREWIFCQTLKNNLNWINKILQKKSHCCKQHKEDLLKTRETLETFLTRVDHRSQTASDSVPNRLISYTNKTRSTSRWRKIVTLKMILVFSAKMIV